MHCINTLNQFCTINSITSNQSFNTNISTFSLCNENYTNFGNGNYSSFETNFFQMTTFQTSTTFGPMEIDSSPISIPTYYQPKPCDKNIVVDGLNVLLGAQKCHREWEEYLTDYMNPERAIGQADHYITEPTLDILFNCIASSFELLFANGATIHFVMKKFGSIGLWQHFLNKFKNLMIDSPNKITYKLYVAEPVSKADKECDDRLAMHLALNLTGQVYLVSNDLYRSRYQHADLPIRYEIYDTPELFDPIWSTIIYNTYIENRTSLHLVESSRFAFTCMRNFFESEKKLHLGLKLKRLNVH